MDELSLQELKQIEYRMLEIFHKFCTENNIRYFLSHGTLLGAIRYKHFIPWDDDIDLLVPREDYDRLMSVYQDDERYKLFSFERNKKYRYPFAKLCDMTTRKEEFNYDNGIQLGVDIDIFPLDAWNNDLKKAKKEVKCIRKNMHYLDLIKLNKTDSENPFKRLLKGTTMCVLKMIGHEHYIKKILQEGRGKQQQSNAYLGCKVWCVYGERGIIPADVFSDTIEIEFENGKYPAPKDYDTYLTCLYGNYLPEPPKEKQKTHHNFRAYRA